MSAFVPVVDRTIQLHDGCIMHVTQDPLTVTASKELPCSCSQASTMPRNNGIPQSYDRSPLDTLRDFPTGETMALGTCNTALLKWTRSFLLDLHLTMFIA
jgi:hypothetical protein